MNEQGPNPIKVAQADKDAVENILNPKKTETKKAPSPEDKELEQKIREQAYYIWEHRMSGDPERQKKWAKEYGLPENAMTADVVDKMLRDNNIEPGTPSAEKFMREWDWLEAEKMIKARSEKQVADDQEAKKKEDAEKAAEPEIRQGLSKGRNLGSRGSRTEQAVRKFDAEKSKMEIEAEKDQAEDKDKAQAELNKAMTDFEAKQKQIAEMRAQKTGRFASLWKTLGIKTKDLSNDAEIATLEKESQELYRDLIAKGIRNFKGDRLLLENFLKQYDEFEVFRNTQNMEIDERGKNGKFPDSVLAGLHSIGKKWSELSWGKKILIGGGIGFAAGTAAVFLGAGTFGAATLTAGYRWGFRAFGAMSAGIARKGLLERKLMGEMEQHADQRVALKMKLLEQYEQNIDAGIAAIINQPGSDAVKKSFEEKSLENTKKAINMAAWSFTISSIVGESLRASGINFGSVLKKFGITLPFGGGGTKTVYPEGHYGTEATGHEYVNLHPTGKYGPELYGSEQEGHEYVNRYPAGKYGPGLYGTEGEGHEYVNRHPTGKYGPELYGSEQEGHEYVNRYPAGKYGPGLYGTEGDGHIPEPEKYPEGKYGPGLYGTEGEGHIPEPEKYSEGKYGPARYGTEGEGHVTEDKASELRAPDAEGKTVEMKSKSAEPKISELRAPDAEGKFANMEYKELGYHKVTPGGGIERSAQAIIKANPGEFGIDPDDPKFNSKVGREAHLLARDLAKKYGISYNKLNEIASHKVQPGDEIRLYKDPLTGKFNLTYNGAAFDKELSAGKVFSGTPKEIGLPSEDIEASQQIDSLEGGKLVPKGAGGTGAAVEDIPKRPSATRVRTGAGGGQIPQEILEQEKIAKDNWAKATEYAEKIAKWKAEVGPQIDSAGQATELRQFISMRGLLNRIVEDANISKQTDFWNQPMDSWKNFVPDQNYVAQDISQSQATDRINGSFDNLRKLRPILEAYKTSSNDTIGECLFRAMKDSKNPLLISKLILK